MSITISMLTIEASMSNSNLLKHGWDSPVHILTAYALELDKQTAGWDWSTCINDTPFDSWANMIELLGKTLAIDIVNESVNSADVGIKHFLEQYFPQKFYKRYGYLIPTTNSLYGGFDNGTVYAKNIEDAKILAQKQIHDGFMRINKVLKENELPTFNFNLDELEIQEG